MDHHQRGRREGRAVVVGQPVERRSKLRLVLIKRSTAAAPDQGVNQHQCRFDFIHQLTEPVHVLEVPVRLNLHRSVSRHIHLLQLLLDLRQRLITIQDQHRPLLHRHKPPTHNEGCSGSNVLCDGPGRHRLTFTPWPVEQHHRWGRQHVGDDVAAVEVLLQQLTNRHAIDFSLVGELI